MKTKNKVIISSLNLRRHPFSAFLFSLIITGLGQLYNGSLSRGILFLFGKTMALIAAPIFLSKLESQQVLIYLLLSLIFFVMFTIWSPIDALRNNTKVENLSSRYRKPLAMSLFSLLFFLIHIIIILFVMSEIKIYRALGNESPLIKKGEYIIINKMAKPVPGNMILSKSGIGRLISLKGEDIVLQQNNILRAKNILPLAPLKKYQKSDFNLPVDETILMESNNNLQYPIGVSLKINYNFEKKIILKKDEVLIASDFRYKKNFYTIIDFHSIQGRAEGILSFSINRIYTPFYIKLIRFEENVITPSD